MNDTVWRQSVTASAGQSSAAIAIPGWVDQVTATAIPGGGGSAVVQHTTDDPSAISNWIDWDESVVTAAKTQALMGAVTALRISATGQAATLIVAGVRKRQ